MLPESVHVEHKLQLQLVCLLDVVEKRYVGSFDLLEYADDEIGGRTYSKTCKFEHLVSPEVVL